MLKRIVLGFSLGMVVISNSISAEIEKKSSKVSRVSIKKTATVVIYGSSSCKYCRFAKDLLNKKGITYSYKEIKGNEKLRTEMLEKSDGKKTVPQIFINDVSIGGYGNLLDLVDSGKLDELLKSKSSDCGCE